MRLKMNLGKGFLLLGSVLILASNLGARPSGKPPNYLWISVDDLNHFVSFLQHTEGNFIQKLYPDPGKRAEIAGRLTPNLDRLARQSMIFSKAYCSQALCGPSRTAMLTGVPPWVSGYDRHHEHFRYNAMLEDVVTLPQYLKASGYYTAGVGKVYHKASVNQQQRLRQDWPDMDYSWSHWIERPVGVHTDGPNRIQFSPYSPDDKNVKFGKTHYDVEKTHDYLNARFISDVFSNGSAKIKDIHGDVQELTLPVDQPFFLACGLFAPHLPWAVPQTFYDRFPVDDMAINDQLREWTAKDIEDLSPYAIQRFVGKDVSMLDAMGAKVHGEGKGQLEAWKAAVQAYLATIAYADHCLGLLVEAIEQSPLRDNTVVILHSDHGWHLGDKFRYRKHALWDPANHSVLLIRDPAFEQSQQGVICEQAVSLQDLYPSVVKRSGLNIPEHVYGRDLSVLLKNPASDQWNNTVVRSFGEGNLSLHTPDYHYIRYQDGSRELYALKSDPWEYSNLIEDAGFRDVSESLNATLERILKWDPKDSR